MAKKDEVKLTSTEKFAQKTNLWIGNNAKLLIGIGIAIIVALVVLVVALTIVDKASEKKFDALSALEVSYSKLDEIGDDVFIKEAEALVSDAGLDSYPGAKAALLIGDVSFDNEDYKTALEWYEKVADSQSKTYLYQVAMIDAAAANEMLGNNSEALDQYNLLWETYGKDGLYGSRALFNAARLYEADGNLELAKATYEQLVGEYSETQSEYASLAKTRLGQLN